MITNTMIKVLQDLKKQKQEVLKVTHWVTQNELITFKVIVRNKLTNNEETYFIIYNKENKAIIYQRD